jgi:porin
VLTTPQSVLSGGRNDSSSFWGNIDYTLNIDTQKLGLWPGGFFKFQADTGFAATRFTNPERSFP